MTASAVAPNPSVVNESVCDFLTISADITERKKLEQALRNVNVELEQREPNAR